MPIVEIIAPSLDAEEPRPVVSRMLSEGAMRGRGGPFVGPSSNGFLSICNNGLGAPVSFERGAVQNIGLTEHLIETLPVTVLNSTCPPAAKS